MLSKLTGVYLVKESALWDHPENRFQGQQSKMMPDAPGVKNMSQRGTEWHEINDASELKGVPSVVTESVKEMQSRFSDSFGQGVKMIFSYIGEDPAIPSKEIQHLESDPNLPEAKRRQFLHVISFMNNFGIRLFMSPNSMQGYDGSGDKNKTNGSNWFFQNFGYAWGAKKVPTGKMRVANPITEVDLQQGAKPGRKHVQVVTGHKNGGWGIFFKDEENQLIPVTSDEYYNRTGSSRDDFGFVDKEHYVNTKGQHKKYFENYEFKKILLPTQTVYSLPNGLQDPNPIPVPKTYQPKKAQVEPMNRRTLARDQKYYIWPRNDGTLWWVPFGERMEKANVHPLTKEQVDRINVKNGQWFDLGAEDVETYSWDTIPADQRARLEDDFKQKTQVMNEIWDYLAMNGFEQDVGLQAYKWCIIGPQFTDSENVDSGETVGKLKSHYTHIRDTGNPDVSILKRKKWVVQSNEFNAARAAAVGGKLNAAQAMSGLAYLAEYNSLKEAINYAFATWHISCPPPDDATIAAAEQSFDAIHNPQGTQQLDSLGQPVQQQAPIQQQQPEPQPSVAPQPVQQPVPAQPAQKPRLRLNPATGKLEPAQQMPMANSSSAYKTASDIIRKLKSI